VQFLNQWKDLTDSRCNELELEKKTKLESICAEADVFCEKLNEIVEICNKLDSEIMINASTIEKDFLALNNELKLISNQSKEEEEKLKKTLIENKRNAVEFYKQSLTVKQKHGDDIIRPMSNKKQLLQSLNEM
jgi:hypothetical protein